VQSSFPLIQTHRLMHHCTAHEEMLPEGIRPMLMPDTPEEAEVLISCLELGLYPTTARPSMMTETQVTSPDSSEPHAGNER